MKYQILGLFLFVSLTSSAFAQNYIFDADDIGPFPAVGSAEEKQDIDQLLFFQQSRTQEQCDAAQLEANAGLEVFFGGNHGLLTPQELKKIKSKVRFLTIKVGAKILINKTRYGRERPYITHKEIKPCIDLESSKAYPSGHATLARVYARVMAVAHPERAFLFLKRADEVGLNRVLGGVHHPSDVAAGKKLGDAIAEKYLGTGDNFYQMSVTNN
jgi:acid phosphatase (class A)